MRRSLAPSLMKQRQSEGGFASTNSRSSLGDNNHGSDGLDGNNGMITIQRVPLFGFLSIPDELRRQFKIPSGCVITEESKQLRATKTLGANKRFEPLRPSGVPQFQRLSPIDPAVSGSSLEEEDIEASAGAPSSVLPPFERLVLWMNPDDPDHVVEVIPQLASRLRPHQREGVQFLFECTMGLRGFDGQGCILADDMGLGKTLMSITLLWTLLNQGIVKGGPSAVRKAVIVCPTSLVGNWDNELRRWVGDHCPTFAVKSEPKRIIKNFIQHRGKAILIVSYETQRRYSKMFQYNPKFSESTCDLMICDEAHKLKNADSGLAKSLNMLPAKKRVLLSGTPMQNELTEFYNMVNFCNPNVLGTPSEFRRKYERPILASREPDASPSEVHVANLLQKELSTIVNEFILKRGNILNAQHLPPKLVQFVCCQLSPLQDAMYDKLLNSKECQHILDGRNNNALNTIRHMINICSHPDMIVASHEAKVKAREYDETLADLAKMVIAYKEGDDAGQFATPHTNASSPSKKPLLDASGRIAPFSRSDRAISRGSNQIDFPGKLNKRFRPELSGKFYVLYRLMETMRAMRQNDRIVIVSNYTSTLDLVEQMCEQNNWPKLRLDGTVTSSKRTKLVDTFNDPTSGAFAFLLSSKAGGCGINLIGGNRLVLFDPDWNPASDKQAAARIWREGQKKRCFIYRFMSTSTIEEKIIQRQLSKEGLVSIVDNKEQVNQFSSKELKALFRRRKDTRSDTHDTLRCTRCSFVKPLALPSSAGDTKAVDALPKAVVDKCVSFLTEFQTYLLNAVQTANIVEFDFRALDMLESDLQSDRFSSLPLFSRRLREVMSGINEDLKESVASTGGGGLPPNVYDEFIKQWTDLVPSLSSAMAAARNAAASAAERCTGGGASRSRKSTGSKPRSADSEEVGPSDASGEEVPGVAYDKGDDDEADDAEEIEEECVEQDGCPDEEDFNRWSHHCSVQTCDDDAMKRAMGDDSTVTFVFGLEVNWTLLQARQAERAEQEELHKQQMKRDIEELNELRRRKREGLLDSSASRCIGLDGEAGSDSDGNGDDGINDILCRGAVGASGGRSGSDGEFGEADSEDDASDPAGDIVLSGEAINARNQAPVNGAESTGNGASEATDRSNNSHKKRPVVSISIEGAQTSSALASTSLSASASRRRSSDAGKENRSVLERLPSSLHVKTTSSSTSSTTAIAAMADIGDSTAKITKSAKRVPLRGVDPNVVITSTEHSLMETTKDEGGKIKRKRNIVDSEDEFEGSIATTPGPKTAVRDKSNAISARASDDSSMIGGGKQSTASGSSTVPSSQDSELPSGPRASAKTSGSAAGAVLKEWSCPSCTYINNKRASKCSMCGTMHVARISSEPDAATSSSLSHTNVNISDATFSSSTSSSIHSNSTSRSHRTLSRMVSSMHEDQSYCEW